MDKNRADRILYILFAVIAASWVLGMLLPEVRIGDLSVFTLLGGAGAIGLVGHIFFNVAPADRATRDQRTSIKRRKTNP